MALYEVAILEHPTEEQKKAGASEKLILSPKAIVAKDPTSAVVAAVMGEAKTGDPSRLEVLVRPFA